MNRLKKELRRAAVSSEDKRIQERQDELLKQQEEQLKQQQEVINQKQNEIKQKEEEINQQREEIKQLRIRVKVQPQKGTEQNQISNLLVHEHDQLLLYKLYNDRSLKKQVRGKLPVSMVTTLITSSPELIDEIQQEAEDKGNYAGIKTFFTFADDDRFQTGWSHQLLTLLKTQNLLQLEEMIRPNEADLKDFNERIGIPRNSLLDGIADGLKRYCGIMLSPMGVKDRIENIEGLPIVHPQICISEDFEGDVEFFDGRYQPLEEGRKAYQQSNQIDFEDVTEIAVQTPRFTNGYAELLREQHNLFLMFIGPAGCGKTTLTKRIVKRCLEENKMAFLISFHQIGKDERWSLQNILFKYALKLHHDGLVPSEGKIKRDFQWVVRNQEKCFIVLDGLDQSAFTISNNPKEVKIDDELFPSELFAQLLSRRFLPDIRIILTSRPHSVVNFAAVVRPNVTMFINDLVQEDMLTLMRYYIGYTAVEVDAVVGQLEKKSPRIYKLIFNPLFLRLFAILHQQTSDGIWAVVTTTARLFREIISFHQDSAHCGGESNVGELNHKLGMMAFKKTMSGSVTFNKLDLDDVGLTANDVQDLVFAVVENLPGRRQNSSLIGSILFYFIHQSVQEFMSASFGLESLGFNDFKSFVEKLFPRVNSHERGIVEIGEDSFSVLRMFIIGLINETAYSGFYEADFRRKKGFFIQYLCEHIRQIFVKTTSSQTESHQKQLLLDMTDLKEERCIEEIRNNLQSFKFVFKYKESGKADEREGLIYFLQKYVTNIQLLHVQAHNWKDNEKKRLFASLSNISGKIEKMNVTME